MSNTRQIFNSYQEILSYFKKLVCYVKQRYLCIVVDFQWNNYI